MTKPEIKNEQVEPDLTFLDDQTPANESIDQPKLSESAPIKKTTGRLSTAEKAALSQIAILAKQELENEPIELIDPDLIDSSPFQNRRFFNKRKISALAESIAKTGQLSPCIARKQGSRYQLAAGERRLRACKEAKIPIKVIIADLDDEKMLAICHAENEKREDTSYLEKYMAARDLIDNYGYSRDDAIQEFKLSQTTFSRLSKIDYLPKEFVEKLAESPLSELMNPQRIEEIGKLVRDNEDHVEDILSSLQKEMDNFFHIPFDSDFEQSEETNKTILAFIKRMRATIKPTSKVREKPINEDQRFEYSLDGRVVGAAKLSKRQFSVRISKEDMPKDVLDKFMLMVENFFQENK